MGNEVSVHDVEMDGIDVALVETDDLITESGEVGGEQRDPIFDLLVWDLISVVSAYQSSTMSSVLRLRSSSKNMSLWTSSWSA